MDMHSLLLAKMMLGGGGGSKVKIASGTIATAQSARTTINHNLGVIPDIVIGYGNTNSTSETIVQVGFGPAFGALYGKMQRSAYRKTDAFSYTAKVGEATIDTTYDTQPIHNANETSFTLYAHTSCVLPAGYRWIAIAGLT